MIQNKDLKAIILGSSIKIVQPEFIFTNFVPFIVRIENGDGKNSFNSSILEIQTTYGTCEKNTTNKKYECNYLILNLSECNSTKFPIEYQYQFEINFVFKLFTI